MLPWATSICFPGPQPFVPCPTTIDVLGPTIRSLCLKPLISSCKPIACLGPNSWNPLYRPLTALPPAIVSLHTNHLCLGPHPLSSFYRPIEFLRIQPVVSRPRLVAVLDYLHLFPWVQIWISWTTTFPFVVQNPALPGYEPLSSRPPHHRLSGTQPTTTVQSFPHTT